MEEGSPAEKAGLQANDVITKVNGTDIKSVTELKNMLAKGSEGDKVTLTIYRQGKTMEVEVTIAVRRQSAVSDSETQQNSGNPFNQGGSGEQNNPFGGNGSGSPFGGTGSDNPFGDSGSDNPFGRDGFFGK